jgi:adenylate kinase
MIQQPVTRTIYSFFGPPGSGKGTLAQKLVIRDNFQMLSTGNLCRQHVAQGTAFGKMLDEYVKQGHLIPDALVTDMVIDWVSHQAEVANPIILDGFPRTKGQAELFLTYVKNTPGVHFAVVSFLVPDEEIVQRLSQRIVCSNKACQTSFTMADNISACKVCQSALTKREDDKEHVIRERLIQFPLYAQALLNYYHVVQQLVQVMDIAGLAQEEVYEHFITVMGIK